MISDYDHDLSYSYHFDHYHDLYDDGGDGDGDDQSDDGDGRGLGYHLQSWRGYAGGSYELFELVAGLSLAAAVKIRKEKSEKILDF